ncbi:Na+/H+ antiporter subunit E [Nitrogeniibacter mangrovi]|uniref:Na+/H+ antiporter subunit E n=1 Tax=Nitrogeniibacter mangrovi TaxID=2016596 RepID=A0A6C1B831_9RHOO|nr:Na+/H+ antiporter subunit E [Nitrogeniibacter mangrovi]QID18975.1 Na+/H+ antiporter subunit E [Nitrogeniibacter mangrovi]
MRTFRSLSVVVTLFAFWLVMSGYFTAFLLTMGVASAIAITAFAHRMDVVDREGHPMHLTASAFTYWPWLVKEIIKAAWDVSKIILDPKLPISPTLVRVKMSQKSNVGQVTYANSITLTPGTISVAVEGDEILVHALTRDGADSLVEGDMDRRVARFEGLS